MPSTPHHVYFIHGIGKHDTDWVHTEKDNNTTLYQQLEDIWKRYNANGHILTGLMWRTLVGVRY